MHYNGSAPVVTALISAEMPYTFENLLLVLPHIHAGTLRAIAVTSRERAALLPEVPTMDEAGLEGFEAQGWYGLLAPAYVPDAIVRRLNTETTAALRAPDVAQRIAEMGSPLGIPSFFQCHIRLLAIHDPEIERSLSLPRLSLRGQAVLLKEYDRVEQAMADEGQVAEQYIRGSLGSP